MGNMYHGGEYAVDGYQASGFQYPMASGYYGMQPHHLQAAPAGARTLQDVTDPSAAPPPQPPRPPPAPASVSASSSSTTASSTWGPSLPRVARTARRRVRQCYNCQKFSHEARDCTNPMTCLVCSAVGHTHKECTATAPHCVNCQGGHRASFKECPYRLAFGSH